MENQAQQFDKRPPMYLMAKGRPLFKVDSVTHTVYGLATSETVDADGEICDYATVKEQIAKWSARAEAVTTAAGQQVSKGNIRLQHDAAVIAGKITDIIYKDDERQVWIATKPANDEMWSLCDGGFVTGFSISGSYLWKKKEGEFTRYGASIVEISYVDLPCNPDAVFEYVKADGKGGTITELRKFQKRGVPPMATPALPAQPEQLTLSATQLADIAQKTAEIIIPKLAAKAAEPLSKEKTKRVDGEDLTASAFAYVGDAEDTKTWKLPIKFSTDEKTASHIRNALSRFEQTKGIPESEKTKVKAKIDAAAKEHGIEVSAEADKVHKALLLITDENIAESIRAAAVKDAAAKAKKGTPYTQDGAKLYAQTFVTSAFKAASDVQKSALTKSLWDVHTVADALQSLCWAQQCLHSEREWEEDDSPVPDDLADVVRDLGEILISLAGEEVKELMETLKSAATRGHEGVVKMALTQEQVAKAHSVAMKITKAKEAVTAYHKMHGSPMEGMHKAHADAMHGHLDGAMAAMKAATDSGDMKKAMPAAGHIAKAMDQMSEYTEKMHKMHKSYDGEMKEHMDGINKAIGTDESIEGEASGPGAGEGMKGITAADLQKSIAAAVASVMTETNKKLDAVTQQNADMAKKLAELENRPADTFVRSVELPKGVVSIARESIGKVSLGGDTDDTLGALAI